jgi:hypothetical protein
MQGISIRPIKQASKSKHAFGGNSSNSLAEVAQKQERSMFRLWPGKISQMLGLVDETQSFAGGPRAIPIAFPSNTGCRPCPKRTQLL